jgi:hypothetical protein
VSGLEFRLLLTPALPLWLQTESLLEAQSFVPHPRALRMH